MTDQEKIQKLEKVIEEAYIAFKLLPDMMGCDSCNERNKEIVENITNHIKTAIDFKKEIV